MADSEVRQKFEAWKSSLLKCVGNSGGCDGDLEGMAHEPNCPLFGKQFATHFDAFAEGMRAGEIAMRENAANCAAEFYLAKGDALDIARAIRALAISGAEESKKEK